VGIDVGLPARSRLGPYVIEDQIGRGGMAVVYRARHVKLERTVAIKVLLGYGSDEIGLRRFQREAQTVARLRHPHILAVFDYGEEAGLPYMATEFMPNGSLADRKRGRVLDAAEAVALLRPLAEALDYAHREGVIHRDVKPSNVFLDADWKPVLADFGISKLNSDEPLTATGNVAGTPAYMSPEQIKGGELSGASDVYSLAAMAYELLTGRTPFIGDDPWQILYGHVKLEPPAPSSLRAELPGGLDAVLASGLAKEPEARWNSCAAMLEAMEAAVEGKRVRPPAGDAGLRRARLRRLGAARAAPAVNQGRGAQPSLPEAFAPALCRVSPLVRRPHAPWSSTAPSLCASVPTCRFTARVSTPPGGRWPASCRGRTPSFPSTTPCRWSPTAAFG
jgi:serine/threonine-protein kinase